MLSFVQQIAQKVKDNVARVIIGKDDVVELLLIALFCEGHVLLEDVPGIGKTTLAKSLSGVASVARCATRCCPLPMLRAGRVVGVIDRADVVRWRNGQKTSERSATRSDFPQHTL